MKKLLFCLALMCLVSCGYINRQLGLNDDNIGEELVEDFIDMETGLDIDLTPDSKEKS